jgi:hypothetical protein
VLGGLDRCGARGHQHVDREADELRRQDRAPVLMALRIAGLNENVPPLDVAEVA